MNTVSAVFKTTQTGSSVIRRHQDEGSRYVVVTQQQTTTGICVGRQ